VLKPLEAQQAVKLHEEQALYEEQVLKQAAAESAATMQMVVGAGAGAATAQRLISGTTCLPTAVISFL
jgi:hypothetical protein